MICFLSVFPPFRGGISRFSDHVLQELKNYDSVLAVNYSKQYPNLLFPGKTQLLENAEKHESLPLIHSYNPLVWFSNKEEFELPCSHIIFSHWHPFFTLSTLAAIHQIRKKNPSVSVSCIIHNVLPHEKFPFQNFLVKTLFSKTDKLITLSTQGSNAMQVFPEQVDKVRQLFHPIYERSAKDLNRNEIREHWGIPQDAFVILFFGLIREYKGLSLLIEAFNKIAETRTDAFLLVTGEFYESQQSYEEQIRPDFNSRVLIKNCFLSDSEAGEVLTMSDVLVLPYKAATQSGVLADAIAYNLPAIATNQPGFTDFIQNGKSGIIMKSQDSEELATILLNLSNDKLNYFRENMAEVQLKFSWKQFGEEIFQEVCKI